MCGADSRWGRRSFSDGQHELVSHTQKTVRDGDEIFVEHRFTTKFRNGDPRMLTVLRVDAESRLPVSWESMIGKTRVFSCQVDFPAHGPQTLYAMGVPRNVEVVDQTPSDDLKRILAASVTGRTRHATMWLSSSNG